MTLFRSGIGSYRFPSKTATHEYTDLGTYIVTLTVDDAAGNQGTDTMVVTVNTTEGFPWWIAAAAGIVAVGIVVEALILRRREKRLSEIAKQKSHANCKCDEVLLSAFSGN